MEEFEKAGNGKDLTAGGETGGETSSCAQKPG